MAPQLMRDSILGNGMNLPSFWDDIEDVHEKEKHYNSLLSLVDQAYNRLIRF